MNTFTSVAAPAEIYTPPDAHLLFWPQIAPESMCQQLYSELYSTLPWQQDQITIYGKTLPVPRLQVWMGDPGAHYQYSGLALSPQPWSQTVILIKQQIEKISGHVFNSVLINLYRSGQDSNSWHSDNEPELGENPVIASFSLGATRRFRLRHRYRKDLPPLHF
ncbi:alpha-ketoglutarate-dependent dioxygenase AlkB family protein [Endozoicomonas atrinae]|uniref:alpha-ketoglutarate-dependent dioxygenase AlkB family protein n=1 Tax=Endozoicomonas atrinae TaxID=1333660 RepID=UPI000AE8F8B0|nr:alpha-ketoglutarate-dependent dioxygenase AlkB [Endozoicomonas atrinae]